MSGFERSCVICIYKEIRGPRVGGLLSLVSDSGPIWVGISPRLSRSESRTKLAGIRALPCSAYVVTQPPNFLCESGRTIGQCRRAIRRADHESATRPWTILVRTMYAIHADNELNFTRSSGENEYDSCELENLLALSRSCLIDSTRIYWRNEGKMNKETIVKMTFAWEPLKEMEISDFITS